MQTTPAVNTASVAEPTYEQLKLRVAQLERDRANESSIVKRTDKGSLSLYGLGKFPVTLTFTQWLIVMKNIPTLKSFAKANIDSLFFKNDDQRAEARKALGL